LTKDRIAFTTVCHHRNGRVHSEAALSAAPLLLRRLLLIQSDTFQCGEQPPNCPLPWGDPGAHLVGCMVQWAHANQQPNGISVGSAICAGLRVVSNRETDRQTDHATSVATVRIFELRACDAA